jgi:FkbM family methyltransferase
MAGMIETVHWHTLHPRYLGRGSTVLDLGANYGHFALAITRRFGCHCVAVEPSPAPFAAIPQSPQISKLQLAISGTSGKMQFRIAESSLASSLASAGDPQTQAIEVQATTLPELLKRLNWSKVDLMKIDIEGAEIDALVACPDHLLRSVAQISVEFHDFCGITSSSDVMRTLDRLRGLGFFSVRMSGYGHQDTWLINRQLLDISTSELLYIRHVVRNWAGFKRVTARQFNRLRRRDQFMDA